MDSSETQSADIAPQDPLAIKLREMAEELQGLSKDGEVQIEVEYGFKFTGYLIKANRIGLLRLASECVAAAMRCPDKKNEFQEMGLSASRISEGGHPESESMSVLRSEDLATEWQAMKEQREQKEKERKEKPANIEGGVRLFVAIFFLVCLVIACLAGFGLYALLK